MIHHRLSHQHKYRFIFLFIVVLASIGLIFYFFLTTFTIKTVTIIGSTKNLTGLDKIGGENIFFMDTDGLTKQLLKSNFLIKKINVKKIFPDNLQLTVNPRIGEVLLISSPSAYFLSDDGVVIGKADNNIFYQFPLIYYNNLHPNIGDTVGNDLQSLLELLAQLKNSNIIVQRIEIDPNLQEAHIVTSDDTLILLSLTKNYQNVATPLQIIMTRFRIEGKSVSTIDFRFDKPIVTLKNGEKSSP